MFIKVITLDTLKKGTVPPHTHLKTKLEPCTILHHHDPVTHHQRLMKVFFSGFNKSWHLVVVKYKVGVIFSLGFKPNGLVLDSKVD